MGTGSSKADNVVKFEDSDDDSWAKDDKPTKKEEKKESVFGKVFGKNKPTPAPTLPTRKIVGESSSSDEDDDYYHDNQLRSDIHQLEAALSNVEDKLDQRKHKRLPGPPIAHYDNGPARNLETRDGILSRDRNKVSKQVHMRKKSDLKFSWDDRDGHKINDDWSIQKVKIEGFDPAKFKAANNKAGSSIDLRNTTSISANIATIGSVTTFAQPPGMVPTYDKTEQQLMASLEQELGF